MKKRYTVLKPLRLGYDSHVREPTPKRYKKHSRGAVLILDIESPNGNVWFIDEADERGKCECGSIQNLVKNGELSLI